MRFFPIFFLALSITVSLVCASSCTLVTQVDRSKIGQGGAGGEGGDTGN